MCLGLWELSPLALSPWNLLAHVATSAHRHSPNATVTRSRAAHEDPDMVFFSWSYPEGLHCLAGEAEPEADNLHSRSWGRQRSQAGFLGHLTLSRV